MSEKFAFAYHEHKQLLPAPAGFSVATCFHNIKREIEFRMLPIVALAAVKNTPADSNGHYNLSNQVPETTIEFLVFSDGSVSTVDDYDEITDSYSEVLEPGQQLTDERKAEMAATLRRMTARKQKKSA
jgi:hypothetical protein